MSPVNESLGNYVSHRRSDSGIEIIAENAVVEVVIYADAVCRVHILKAGEAPDGFSYAVIAAPLLVDFLLDPGDAAIRIQTRCFVLTVQKFPLRLSFSTLADAVINADDPAFGTSWIGETISTYKSLKPGERFLGLGEKTGSLDRAGSAFTNWNTDHFAYPADADPLYTSMPFYIGVHSGLCYGIFLDSTYQSTFNFGASNNRFSFFTADGGSMDYYFIHDDGVAGILKAFSWLVGRIPMPPFWSLGYQQCRFSYYPDAEVRALARGFRERDIPADGIYLDIHYMDGFRVFTWDQERFPAPAELVADLNASGFHVVAILDPGIKIEAGYGPYEDGQAWDVFLKYPDGELFAAEVWPGWCHFPDFTRPGTRKWWGAWIKTLVETGIEGFWNDMNEPSAWGQNIPNLVEFDFEGKKASHKKAHNVYGMQMARSTWEGVVQWMGNRRPFVLTRAGFTGVQRYSAVWTGDNVSDDAHMFADIRLVNSMGLSGMPFCSYDIGGFSGECTPNLFARWISVGMFAPFSRGHTMVNSRDAEPWSFGEAVEGIARNYIKLRYRLLPYIYSLFYECSRSGMPVSRSLAIDYTQDPKIYAPAYENQFLFGDAILVVPAGSQERIIRIYLPEGRWYDFYTDEMFAGGAEITREAPVEKLPLFVRAGAIIPMQTPVCCTRQIPEGPLQLHVYAESGHSSSFTYYEDDGCTMAHLEGNFFKREIVLSENELVLEPAEGAIGSGFSRLKIYLHGFSLQAGGQAYLNGEALDIQKESLRLVEPVSSFDTSAAVPDPYGEVSVFSVQTRHESGQMRFRLF